MEIQPDPHLPSTLSTSPFSHRSKSSIRIRYEAEAEVLRRKLGDLEAIRGRLGLSQRKICQLLLVDPSAWSRWTRTENGPPPHIYRALQWYMALEEKYPALDVGFWLSTAPRAQESQLQDSAWKKTSSELEQLRRELEELRQAHQSNRRANGRGPDARSKIFGISLVGLIGGPAGIFISGFVLGGAIVAAIVLS